MKFFTYVLAFAIPFNSYASKVCVESTTTEPPFYVSDATDMGTKNYENFRKAVNLRQIQSSIPKRSIVRILDKKNKSHSSNSKYIGVEVLSTPATSGRASHSWAQKGEKGFIYHDSLVRPSSKVQQQITGKYQTDPKKNADYIFEVSRDVPFLVAGDLQLKRGQYLKLATITDTDKVTRFKIRECCEQVQTTVVDKYENRNCKLEYTFALLAENKKDALREIYFDPNETCDKNVASYLNPTLEGSLQNIAAVVDQQQDQFKPTTTYVNPETVKSAGAKPRSYLAPVGITNEKGQDLGFAKILLVKKLVSAAPNSLNYDWYEGPYGSYHYNIRPNTVGRAQTSGTKDAVCAFTHVMKDQQASCKGGATCNLIFGDFYSPLSEKARDGYGRELASPIHRQHHTGRCVDVQIGSFQAQNNSAYWTRYTSHNTKFKTLAASYGGTVLDHGDHMHVCFNPPDKYTYSKMKDCLDNPWQYEKGPNNSLASSN